MFFERQKNIIRTLYAKGANVRFVIFLNDTNIK